MVPQQITNRRKLPVPQNGTAENKIFKLPVPQNGTAANKEISLASGSTKWYRRK
jgi:hypothetical protein